MGLGLAMALTCGAALPAQAQLKNGSTFTLFLECNNDGSALIVGSSAVIDGWQYTSDARNDNTDGYYYDIAGMALKQTADEIVVVLNGNTPLIGTGYDRQANQVVWGDLFFTGSTYGSFQAATNAGDLYGIHFAETNESGVNEVGVYRNVVGTGVGVNNFGHNTYGNYMSLVDTKVENFFGDIQTADTEGSNAYLDTEGFGVNVIGQGDKVYGDGFELLGLDNELLASFDLNNFVAPGDEIIAFKINLSALQYQPPIREQAADLGVDWIWDEDFATLETELETVAQEIDAVTTATKAPNKANAAIRNATPGFSEVAQRNSAVSKLSTYNKDLAKFEALVSSLTAKKAAWEALSSEEQASADPAIVWTNKDEIDLKYQTTENIPAIKANIQEIQDTYTDAELATAKQDYKEMLDKIRADNTELDTNGEDYTAREQRLKELNAQKKTLQNQQETLKEDIAQLDGDIRKLLADTRQELIAARIAVAEEAAATATALEAEMGGPRTSAEGGIPGSEAELKAFLNPGIEAESVPEPGSILALMAIAGAGITTLKRSQQHP